MNSKYRLLEFLKHKGISQRVFEGAAGISNGYVNNNKGSIGSAILSKIKATNPDLNIDWLMTGEGEMLKTESHTEVKSMIAQRNNGIEPKGVPY